jgi:hypothetical protein
LGASGLEWAIIAGAVVALAAAMTHYFHVQVDHRQNCGDAIMFLITATAQSVQASAQNAVGMTTAGWIFMAIAWITIISIAVFCYRKILQKASERRQRELLESPPLGLDMEHKKVYK